MVPHLKSLCDYWLRLTNESLSWAKISQRVRNWRPTSQTDWNYWMTLKRKVVKLFELNNFSFQSCSIFLIRLAGRPSVTNTLWNCCPLLRIKIILIWIDFFSWPWCQAVCTKLWVDFSAKSAFLVAVHLVAGLPKLPESKSFEIPRKHKKKMLIGQVSPF